jgi:hypothetical protein
MKNWKTTVGGILAASSDVIPVNNGIQQLIRALGLLLLGWAAKDHTTSLNEKAK